MRALMILVLLLASIGMAVPQGAQAAQPVADCHASMGHETAPQSAPVQRGKLGHACPGCALLVPPGLADRAAARVALPQQVRATPPGPSLIAQPVPPPPRQA